MQQPCPACEYQNTSESIFCLRCGKRLSPTEGIPLPFGPQHTNPQLKRTGLLQGDYDPNNTSSQAGKNQGNQNMSMTGTLTSADGPLQMGSQALTVSGPKLRHAFAGYGRATTHQSWLLEGKKNYAASLYTAVAKLTSQRSFLAMNVQSTKLTEAGYWSEEREYILMRRGVASIFIYIAPAGHDLYISRTTLVQLPLETTRIIIAALMGAELLAPLFITISAAATALGSTLTTNGTGNSADSGTIFALLATLLVGLLYVPTLIVAFTFLYNSFRNWLSERDFLVYLRRNTLNDFEIDDVHLLEHATDEAIITATKQMNLDATKITPPAMGYQVKRRIRII